MKGIAAALAALGAGAVAYLKLRRQSTMTPSDLVDFLAPRAPDTAQPYLFEVARAAIDTQPRDFFQDDPDAALRRWALLIVAIGDHESHFATGAGYFPKDDPTGWGDRGNAFGIFQLDKRYHWTFIQSAAAQTVYGQALYAARILRGNWARFSGTEDQGERERLAVITYNASAARVAKMIADGATVDDADATTSKMADGTPYGIDVLLRVERMT